MYKWIVGITMKATTATSAKAYVRAIQLGRTVANPVPTRDVLANMSLRPMTKVTVEE